MTTTFHTDGIVGMVCAHNTDSVWRLRWHGPGTTDIHISGRCMIEPQPYFSHARGLPGVSTATEFKQAAREFYTDTRKASA